MAEPPAPCPRPLQLASAFVIASSRVDIDEGLHHTPSFYTPPRTVRATTTSNRRHSSISYIRSGPSDQEFSRRETVDSIFNVSEAAPSRSTVPQRNPNVSLCRTNSLGGRVSNSFDIGSKGAPFRDSIMAKRTSNVTLAEKHAELLQFIAQKESKCLEIRSQLAVHEAELLQLKRKWEIIVNRGFELSKIASPPSFAPFSSTQPPPIKSPSLPSTLNVHHGSQTMPPPYFHLPATHAPVLEGIKEGVQGVSRLIAAGFESFSGGPADLSHQTGPLLPHHPLPLLLGSVSQLEDKPPTRHGQNESQSSSSTAPSSTLAITPNTSTTSDRRSLSFDGPSSPTTPPTSPRNDDLGEEGKQLDDNEPLGGFEQQSETGTPASDKSEQVLIVRDTGATPTMSPNPDFERKRRSKRLNERRGEVSAGRKHSLPKNLDAWLDSGCLEKEEHTSRPTVNGRTLNTVVRSSKSPSSLPPMSTIPGLATINLTGPAAQQVSSWVGTVGKKLGEIRDSETFTKGQKRASLLLTDMQNTLVSSLITSSAPTSPSLFPPVPAPPPTPASNNNNKIGRDRVAFLKPFNRHAVVSVMSEESSPIAAAGCITTSILDAFDSEWDGHIGSTLLSNSPVLVPEKSPGTTTTRIKSSSRLSSSLRDRPRHKITRDDRGEEDEEEDWNW